MKSAIALMVSLVLLAPSVLADLATPPLGLVFAEFVVFFSAFLLLNFGINFVISYPLICIVSRIPAKKLAKGLLIITPIMLAFESIFAYLVDPKDLITTGMIYGQSQQ